MARTKPCMNELCISLRVELPGQAVVVYARCDKYYKVRSVMWSFGRKGISPVACGKKRARRPVCRSKTRQGAVDSVCLDRPRKSKRSRHNGLSCSGAWHQKVERQLPN